MVSLRSPSFVAGLLLVLAALASQGLAQKTAPLATDTQAYCPRDFSVHDGSTLILVCYCAPEAMAGSIWGTGIYTSDSSMCLAAQHAGVIGEGGGMIAVQGFEGQEAYEGTTSNGVTSAGYGAYGWSFVFPPITVTLGVVEEEPEECPYNFVDYRDSEEMLRCTCPPERFEGSVWGTDLYTDDSSICAAALHAGVVPETGGAVTVTGAPGQGAYKGSSRNGITTNSYPSWDWSFRFVR